MFKNTASQHLTVFAFDATTNLPKSGDAANITAYVSKDDGTVTVLGDTSATEQDATNAKGYYIFDLTQAETNGDKLTFSAKSATANIVVIGAPSVVYTLPANLTSATLGNLDAAVSSRGTSTLTQTQVSGYAGPILTDNTTGAVKLSSGTGTGQLDFTGGVVKSSLVQILGTAITETAGLIAAAFSKFFNKATPTGTVNSLPDAVAGAASGLLIAGSNAATTFASVTCSGAFTVNGNNISVVGSQQDLVNAPNATAITAIQSGLATTASQTAIKAKTDLIGTNAADSPNAVTAQNTISVKLDATSSSILAAATSGATQASNAASLAGSIQAKINGEFDGMTSLGNWLRAIARKDAPDTTALSEINATTNSINGTYDATADSTQAIATGGGTSGATIGQMQATFGPGPYGPIDDESAIVDAVATRLLSDPSKKIQLSDDTNGNTGVFVHGGDVDTVNNAPPAPGTSPVGKTPIDETTIDINGQTLLIEVNGVPMGGVLIYAYLSSEWHASPHPMGMQIQGESLSNDQGKWVKKIWLDSGLLYTIVSTLPNDGGTSETDVNVP
jgi:hypothetical protein